MTEVFTFGRHKGKKLEDIPGSYLEWAVHNCDNLDFWLQRAILQELERRTNSLAGSYTPGRIPAAVSLETALQLVAEGRRGLARREHPDVGGDAAKMTQANATADYLENALRELFAGVRR